MNQNPWACWKSAPMPHPFDPSIPDVACGYEGRQWDPRCAGCHRQRDESVADQLRARDALGDAA